MGKITVKHYLNTDTKGEQMKVFSLSGDEFKIDEKNTLYPVYLQITVNRKTTKLRSYTSVVLYKPEFESYLKRGTYVGEKKEKDYNTGHYLSNEIESVKQSLNYFYNIKEGNQEEYPIKNVTDFYMIEFESDYFFKKLNGESIYTISEDYDDILLVIKDSSSPILLIDFFKKRLSIDLYSILGNEECCLLKSVALFFSFLPKDKSGRLIGRLIEWYNGNTKSNFKKYLEKNTSDFEFIFSSFDIFMDNLEKYNSVIRGKYNLKG